MLRDLRRRYVLWLHRLWVQYEAGDPDALAQNQLRRDPEDEAIAREFVATNLTRDVIRLLREANGWRPIPSWVPRIAQELPQHALRGALESPTEREAIARAMVELAGVDIEEARAELLDRCRRADELFGRQRLSPNSTTP